MVAVGGAIFLLIMIIFLLTSIFWVWMLVDCATNPRLQGTEKIVWILIVLFAHIVGALIYFFVARQKKNAV